LKKNETQRIAKILILLKKFGINPYNLTDIACHLDINASKLYSISDASFINEYYRIIEELSILLKLPPIIFFPESLTGISIEDACYDVLELRRKK